jgi:site-specific recombinase XerD
MRRGGYRRLKRDTDNTEYVFVSERGSPFATAGFAKLVERAGLKAGFKFGTHPHMIRHSCGYKLANDGHDTRSRQDLSRTRQHSPRGAL